MDKALQIAYFVVWAGSALLALCGSMACLALGPRRLAPIGLVPIAASVVWFWSVAMRMNTEKGIFDQRATVLIPQLLLLLVVVAAAVWVNEAWIERLIRRRHGGVGRKSTPHLEPPARVP